MCVHHTEEMVVVVKLLVVIREWLSHPDLISYLPRLRTSCHTVGSVFQMAILTLWEGMLELLPGGTCDYIPWLALTF